MLPTIRGLRHFLAAYDVGGVGAAAVTLGLSTAAVSHQLTALEHALGVSLFARTTGGLLPTRAGRRLERIVRPTLGDLDAALRRVRHGTLRAPEALGVALPLAPPGSPARAAVEAAQEAMEAIAPHLVLQAVPLPADVAPLEEGIALAASASPRALHDRWVILGPSCLTAQPTTEVLLPVLDPTHARAAAALAKARGFRILPLDRAPDRLDEAPRPPLLPILLPSLLVPGRARVGETRAVLPPGPHDPCWTVVRHGRAARDPVAARAAVAVRAALERLCRDPDTPPPPPPRPLPVERDHLECLVASLDHASLTRAAAELGISQPAATLRLRSLEACLSQRLFERTPGGLRPTLAGTLLAAPARAFLTEARRLGPTLAALADTRGLVRAGLVPALDDSSLLAEAAASAAAAWNRRHPDRRLHLVQGKTDDLRRSVLTGALEFAVVDTDVPWPGLAVRSVTREPMVAVTAAGSPLLDPGPVALATLASKPLALAAPNHGLRRIIEDGAARAGVDLSPAAEIDDLAVTIRLVRSGEWVTILPSAAVRGAVRAGILQAHPVVEPVLERRLSLVRRHGEPLSEPTLRLVDLLIAFLNAEAG